MSLLSKALSYAPEKKQKALDVPEQEAYEVAEAFLRGEIKATAVSLAVSGKDWNGQNFLLRTLARGFRTGRYTINETK